MNRYIGIASLIVVALILCCAPPIEPDVQEALETEESLKYSCVIEHDGPQLAIGGDYDELLWDYWFWHNRYPNGHRGGNIRPDSTTGDGVIPHMDPFSIGWSRFGGYAR